VFQPHQARRILEGWTGFVSALSHSDQTIIYNLYAAREEINTLKQEFASHDLHHIHSFAELGTAFAQACQ
jgi:UDP-N-acetylmuramate-alanine ligase